MVGDRLLSQNRISVQARHGRQCFALFIGPVFVQCLSVISAALSCQFLVCSLRHIRCFVLTILLGEEIVLFRFRHMAFVM